MLYGLLVLFALSWTLGLGATERTSPTFSSLAQMRADPYYEKSPVVSAKKKSSYMQKKYIVVQTVASWRLYYGYCIKNKIEFDPEGYLEFCHHPMQIPELYNRAREINHLVEAP